MDSKHNSVSFFKMTLLLATVEIASFLAWQFPSIAWFCFVYILLRVAIASYKDLRVGIAVAAVELIIGSQGYLFSVPIHGFTVSIRLGLFLVLILISCIHSIRSRSITLLRMPWFPFYITTVAVIAYGVCVALFHHYSFSSIFFDVNAWLFLGLALPVTQAIRTRDDIHFILAPITFALWWLFGKTLLISFLFSHPLATQPVSTVLYLWLRDTRIAEIFRFPSGFARVFLQSHIYALVAMSALYIKALTHVSFEKKYRRLFFAMLFTVLLSYSRTFWLMGGVVLLGVTLVLFCRKRGEWRRMFSRLALTVGYGIFSVFLVVLFVRIPLPHDTVTSGSLFSERVTSTTTEAAAMTRAQEFRPLFEAITKHPILGAGFGATVTYTSSDPRIVATHANGQYTTSAFELGYLDLWLKLGCVGTAYIVLSLLVLVYIAIQRYRAHNDSSALFCAVAILLVLSVHVLTPYINHPLGIGIILGMLMYLSTSEHRHV